MANGVVYKAKLRIILQDAKERRKFFPCPFQIVNSGSVWPSREPFAGVLIIISHHFWIKFLVILDYFFQKTSAKPIR